MYHTHVLMLIKSQMEIVEKRITGAKAERNGDRTPDDPMALDIPKIPQKTIDIPTAIPIP